MTVAAFIALQRYLAGAATANEEVGPRRVPVLRLQGRRGSFVVAGGTSFADAPGDGLPPAVGAAARFLGDGTRDASFSGDGVAKLDPANRFTLVRGVAVDDAGRIVLTGPHGDDFAVGALPAGWLPRP